MNKWHIGIGLCLLAILALRFELLYLNASKYTNGQKITVETVITDSPKKVGNGVSFSINPSGATPIFVFLPHNFEANYGDKVKISGTLKYKVLDSKRTILTMQSPTVEAIESTPLSGFGEVRKTIYFGFKKTLPADLASLMAGIVFGVKEPMSEDFTNSLRTAGVMHVVAASGMNVVFVIGFLSGLFSLIFKRQAALGCTIVGIVLYALLSGFSASIVRASVMGILVLAAQILGRQYLASYGLLLAGYGMLMVNPAWLFDVGFQLSFLSTAGLLYLRPAVGRLGLLGEDFGTTVAAQLATLPVLINTFGTYSVFSILANMLVLWTIPILMVFGCIAGVFYFVFAPIGYIFSYVSLPFLLYFEIVIHSIAQLTSLQIGEIPMVSVIGYYLLLGALVVITKNPPSHKASGGPTEVA